MLVHTLREYSHLQYYCLETLIPTQFSTAKMSLAVRVRYLAAAAAGALLRTPRAASRTDCASRREYRRHVPRAPDRRATTGTNLDSGRRELQSLVHYFRKGPDSSAALAHCRQAV